MRSTGIGWYSFLFANIAKPQLMSRSLLRSIYLKLGRFILVNQQIVDFSKSIDGLNQCVIVFGEMESNIIVVVVFEKR